jgi:hypothetical protein
MEKDQSRREVSQHRSTDLGTDHRRLLDVVALDGLDQVIGEPAVATPGQGVGAPLRVLGMGIENLIWCHRESRYGNSRNNSVCGSAPVTSARSGNKTTFISLRTPNSPGR